MTAFREKYGPWAIITGASSGIGEEFARQLAPKGLNLLLIARRIDKLELIASELRAEFGIEVKSVQADLTQDNFMNSIDPAIDGLEIGLLINNAGIGITGDFLDHTLEQELDLLHTNCRAPLILTHAVAPRMVQRGKGGIIFVSSLVAFIAAPNWLGYSSSKVYDLYIANALWGELRDKGIDVQALCPGVTETGFGKKSGISKRTKSLGRMQKEPVVDESLRKLGRKQTVIPGVMNKISYILIRILPRKLLSLVMYRVLSGIK